MFILIDAEKTIDKIQHTCMTKNLNNLGIEGNFLSRINSIYEKSIVNIIFSGERLKAFHIKSGAKEPCLLSPRLFNFVPEVLARTIRQEGNKRHPN